MAGLWGAAATTAISGIGSLLGGGGLSKSQKRANQANAVLTNQAMPREFSFSLPGGAKAGYQLGEQAPVQRDARGNAVPGITDPGGRALVVGPGGRLLYEGSGKRYKGGQVIDQNGQSIPLGRKGRFAGEFSLNGPQTSEFSADAGDLTGLRTGFRQAAETGLAQGTAPLDLSGVQSEADLANAFQAAGIPQADVGALLENAAAARGAATDFLGKSGQDVLAGLFGGFEGAAQGALAELGQGTAGLEQQQLDLLREKAAPQSERQFNALQSKLFSQGRLGTTGGARAFQAFAEAENAADLDRQLSARDLGLRTAEQQRSIASTTGALANQVAGTGNALSINNLQAALSAFGQAAGLQTDAFNQKIQTGDRLRDLGADRYARATDILGLISGERNRAFDVAQTGLSNVQGIDQSLLDLFKTAAVGEQGRQAGVGSAAAIFSPTVKGASGSPAAAGVNSFLDAGGGAAVGQGLQNLFKRFTS